MTVAIVGRPNVGKSTIFNRLVGRRLSIVHPTPGVTRDRVFAYAEWRGKIFGLFDTGGFWPDKKILFEEVVDSIRRAVEESDLVLLVIDGKIGATPLDQELYRFLRRMGKRIIIVVNKLDRPGEVIYDLPFPEPSFMVSAIHGHGFYELLEEMTKGIEVKKEEKPEHLRLLILGRPNVGKSTLLNRLLGRKRAVVEPTPGTTRDPLSDFFEFRGEKIELIDTAGIRRRSRIRGAIEFYSVLRALKLIPQSDISFLLFDSVEGPVRQDLRLAELVLLRGKGLVVVPNKIDLIPADRLNQLVVETRRYFSRLIDGPIIPISARTGKNLEELMRAAIETDAEGKKRIDDETLKEIVTSLPPPPGGNRILSLYQVGTRPPLFEVRSKDELPTTYLRFLRRKLREYFRFFGQPIVLKTRWGR